MRKCCLIHLKNNSTCQRWRYSFDQLGLEGEVVGQKREPLARLVFDHHPAQRRGVVLVGIEHRQNARLIADDVGIFSIDRVRVAPLELGVALGAGHK
jgi:hypothetical protein